MRNCWKVAVGRLRQAWVPVVEAALAATVAWLIAARLIGHPDPFFAPSAALIVLGESRGQRVRQTIELVLGVAGGVLVADLVVHALGPGTGTMLLVLLLTLGVTVAAGASSTLVIQTTISALYLVVVAAPKGEFTPFRFVDALIGGAVALAASQLVVARDPLAPLVAEARRTYADLAALLERIDEAIDRCDADAGQAALECARELDGSVERLRATVQACAETLRLRVRRRRHLGQLEQVEATARQLDYAVRDIRVLARNAATLTRLRTAAPPELGAALRSLAEAVRAAGAALATDLTGQDADRHAGRADEAALTAVRIGAELLRSDPPLPIVMIVGQVRSTAIDLLRGVGTDDVEVLNRVDEALGLPVG
ncbi:FUSC family protein [Micromonospora halotolerans]|uniref:FUSC family protein n=1 Tax=Micromonospora halotolerans TaxID=709879 RepID=A0ABY9ZSD4_9ACTN|nr:FUSC family protein [Micromonospora halotolerans]WNM38129.1 FUSC family protein [Micromonospora halotolerans]